MPYELIVFVHNIVLIDINVLHRAFRPATFRYQFLPWWKIEFFGQCHIASPMVALIDITRRSTDRSVARQSKAVLQKPTIFKASKKDLT
jgi:hypothetical protein